MHPKRILGYSDKLSKIGLFCSEENDKKELKHHKIDYLKQ